MFVPGVNGSIISNAPSGSKLKGAFKNSKKRKMPNGGTLPPMYTSNPRRVQLYQDSLNLYNKYQPSFDKYKNWTRLNNIQTTSLQGNNLFNQYWGPYKPKGPSPYNENIIIKPVEEMMHQYLRPRPAAGPGRFSQLVERSGNNYLETKPSDYLRPNARETRLWNAVDNDGRFLPEDVGLTTSQRRINNARRIRRFPVSVTKEDFLDLGLTGVTPDLNSVFRFKKPVQPYVYKKPEIIPEVKETPVVEPPKPSLFVSNIDRDMYTPNGGMAREYNIGVTLQDGSKKAFKTEKEYQDWKSENNLDISKAKVTEGRGYSYNYYPENKKYGGRIMPNGGSMPNTYNTQLNRNEERDFNLWHDKNYPGQKIEDSIRDYDLRGAYREIQNGTVQFDERHHLPDKYKKPNHITFSKESVYASKQNPGGNWYQSEGKSTDEDKKAWHFKPSAQTVALHGADRLQEYFKTNEPESKLIINKVGREMANGGTLPPRYTSNPRDPRIGRYRDSLNLYKKGESDYASYLKTNKRLNIPSTSTLIQNNPYVYDGDTPAKIQPIISHRYWYNHNPDVISGTNIPSKTIKEWTDRYKKPVQPYIYKKPTASTRSILTEVSKPYVYKKPEVVPEVVETPVAPIEQPVKKINYIKPIIQQFNYMSIENKAKALQKYGSVSDIPYQGVNINELKDGGRLNKYQTGGEDIQKRLNRYMAQDNTKSYALPNGLSFNTGLKGIQNQYLNQNLPTDKLGDLSPQVLEDLRNSAKNLKLDYRSSLNLPRKLGNIGYNSSYGLANPKSTKDLLTDLTYTRSFPGGNIRATADSQQLNLKSKDSNLNISRNVKDSKVSNQFNFNAQVLPEALSVYGAGQFNPNDVLTFKGIDPLKSKVNAKGNVGVRGTTKNLDYDVKGSYDPKTGLNYQGDAAVRMFKDRLNVSGSATTKNQLLDAYNLDASLKLGKNLNLSAFRRNEDGEESYGARVKANLGPVDLDLYQNKVDDQNSYGATLNTNVGPVNLSGNANYNSNMMQDYNVAADVDLLRATKQNPNRGTLNLSGNYGASRDEMGTMSPSYGLNLKYTNSFQKGGETDPVMEGEKMQELHIHKKLSWSEKLRRNINRFEKKIGLGSAKKVNDVTEGSTSWTPTVPKPYMRTMQEPPGGYRDNMQVVTPDSFIDSANRARIDAQQAEEARRKRSGVISQGTPRSAYEKAREASSFVSQAKRRKGSADPLDYVLDMVNPAAIGFAGVDLIGSTGSAVSNLAQGNLKEAGSDLLNAGLNTLQIIPATRGLRGPLKSASKHLTTNTALKNTYKYNPLAFKPNSEAYYRVMPEAGAKDLINSGFVRPAEGSPTSYFNKGVPLDIRRARTFGNDTREAYHGYKGPYMVESNNPNAFDPWLQFPEPSLKFYQTKAPIPASDIKLYKEDWLRGYKQIKKPGLKEGGKIDHSNDKDMVNGVASILRRVESKPNRLKLANQLSKQFNREKVKYDLPSFLSKSKVKK